MKRRKFVSSSLLAASSLALGAKSALAGEKKYATKQLYEWREYDMKFGSNQGLLHEYFEKSLIPALNRNGVKAVGAFRELGKSEPPKIYLLIAYPSFEDYPVINAKVKNDKDYQASSTNYYQNPAEKAIFSRVNVSFLTAFDGLTQMTVPAKEPRIFELRTYEGYNEDAVRRKVKMFNDAEFPIFYKTKLNPVFFGEMIAGKNFPCLTYMVTFKNMEERDANWKNFGADADWKKVSADPQYANTVSNIIRVFLEPTPYSQV
jgi:NIPSNAP